MKLTKLSAAWLQEWTCRLMPAPAGSDAGTASQLIPGVRRTMPGRAWASVAVLLASLLAAPASPCSCVGQKPPAEALASASAVFRGVIVKVTRASELSIVVRAFPSCSAEWLLAQRKIRECLDEHYQAEYYDTASFRVEKVWKGAVPTQVDVRSAPPTDGGGSCGLSWRKGDEWVVYAYEYGSVLYSTSCNRSRSGESVSQEVHELDALPPR
jgi:hypothetical protein